MSERRARESFYLVDRPGLLLAGMSGLAPFQASFAQDPARVADWKVKARGTIDLEDVVANAQPTVLIGTSGQPGAFTEPVVRAYTEARSEADMEALKAAAEKFVVG